jgi:hypothetical protein
MVDADCKVYEDIPMNCKLLMLQEFTSIHRTENHSIIFQTGIGQINNTAYLIG